MYHNISKLEKTLEKDKLSQFLSEFDFRIESFTKWGDGPNKKIENFIITDYDLLLINKGQIKISTENSEYRCGAGEIVLLEPFKLYTAERKTLDDMDFYNIHFNIFPEHKKMLLLGNALKEDLNIFRIPHLNTMHEYVEKVYANRSTEDKGLENIIKSILQIVITEILINRFDCNSLKDYELSERKGELKLINKSIEYIEQNISNPIKVTDISSEVNVSENYLYKIFIRVLGLPPTKYIMHYKIKQAKELLNYSDCTLEEIAYKLGFSSSYHLSNSFKKNLGVSPTNYRKLGNLNS
ncbi:MAG: helix-turn-helix transcriptional regulator [Clostridiales bacterium]|nr:helix-turn-helix transcriptional regulator [Clostridiales bacterium]